MSTELERELAEALRHAYKMDTRYPNEFPNIRALLARVAAKQDEPSMAVDGAWLEDYLATAKPDPAKTELAKRDREVVSRFKTLAGLKQDAVGQGEWRIIDGVTLSAPAFSGFGDYFIPDMTPDDWARLVNSVWSHWRALEQRQDAGRDYDRLKAEYDRVSALWNEHRMAAPEERTQWARAVQGAKGERDEQIADLQRQVRGMRALAQALGVSNAYADPPPTVAEMLPAMADAVRVLTAKAGAVASRSS